MASAGRHAVIAEQPADSIPVVLRADDDRLSHVAQARVHERMRLRKRLVLPDDSVATPNPECSSTNSL